MTDPAVASPCIGVCSLDPARALCTGCLRTIEEIAAWASLDDAARRAIIESLESRRSAHPLAEP